MNFFGLGIWEILFIVMIVLVVVGPERLPQLARQLGLLIARVQSWLQRSPDARMIMQARQELEREIANLRSEMARMQQAQQQLVASAQQAINEPLAALKSVEEDLKNAGKSIEDSVKEASSAGTTSPAEAGVPPLAGDAEPPAIAAPPEPASSPDLGELVAQPQPVSMADLPAEEASSALVPQAEPRAVARSSGTTRAVDSAEVAASANATQPGLENPSNLPLDSLYVERPPAADAQQIPQEPELDQPTATLPESQLMPESIAETAELLASEADVLADLTAQTETATVATQFAELTLRVQALAADLALFQHELQRRGLLEADSTAPAAEQPARNGKNLTDTPPYAEPVTSSATSDS